MPAPTAPTAPRVLRSLGDGVRLAHAHFLKLFPIALLVGWTVDALVAGFGGSGPFWAHLLHSRFTPVPSRESSSLLTVAVTFVDAFLPTLLVTACVADGVRSITRERPPRPLKSVAAGLRRAHVALATACAWSIVPMAAVGLPYRLGGATFVARHVGRYAIVVVPLIVLLVTAIVARFALATPAAVVERLGVISAWRRSERLVEGAMWRVIGLVILIGLIWAALFCGVVIEGTLALDRAGFDLLRESRSPSAATVAIACGLGAFEAWLQLQVGVVTTLLFDRLRRAKEGPDGEELKDVFA